MQNATYLTDKHEDEDGVWSPCLVSFFASCKGAIIPLHRRVKTDSAPWYRQEPSQFSIDGKWLSKTYGDKLIEAIARFSERAADYEQSFEILNDLRWAEKAGMSRDMAGIRPDFVFLPAKGHVCYLVENKPFYHSSLTGNQIADGDYINLANAINAQKEKLGIELKVVFIHPASWKKDSELIKMNKMAGENVFSLLYESIFKVMGEHNFSYKLNRNGPVFSDWERYSDLSKDA